MIDNHDTRSLRSPSPFARVIFSSSCTAVEETLSRNASRPRDASAKQADRFLVRITIERVTMTISSCLEARSRNSPTTKTTNESSTGGRGLIKSCWFQWCALLQFAVVPLLKAKCIYIVSRLYSKHVQLLSNHVTRK